MSRFVPRSWKIRPGDLLLITSVILSGYFVFFPHVPRFNPATIHVATHGYDWYSGQDPDRPLATIQRAADIAIAGDTILIQPGLYRESIRVRRGGKPGKPMVFKAATPGLVTLTLEAEPDVINNLVWQNEGDGVFSAETPWPVYHMRTDGMTLFHIRWGGIKQLRNLMERENPWPSFFYDYDSQRVFVAFPDHQSPELHELSFHRSIPSPREWGNIRTANVWVEAGHIVFDGIKFDFGVGSGLLLWKAESITIRNCQFSGTDYGVTAHPQVKPAKHITIEQSLYHNYPQYEWRKDWLSWQEVYAYYSSSTLVSLSEDDVVVRGNIVTQAGDGLQLSTKDEPIAKGVQISGNLLFRGTDDAIEFDGHAKEVDVEQNLIADFHNTLGLSPVLSGPVRITNNLVLNTSKGMNGAQFKLLNPWLRANPADSDPIRNIEVSQNTIVGNWLAWWNESPVEDMRVYDNRFMVKRIKTPPWPEGVEAVDNEVEFLQEEYAVPDMDSLWRSGDQFLDSRANAREQRQVGIKKPWTIPRPGPKWLDWSTCPATAAISDVFPSVLFHP
jgi:hypothetical protein